MHASPVIFSIFLIFVGAAVLATVALYARQAMIIAYILLGLLLGPWGSGYIDDPAWIKEVSEIGIMFLLYLLGLNMLPRQLWQMLGEALFVTVASCVAFTVAGVGIAFGFGFPWHEAFLIGATMMFSSTIIGLKLLPTTALHHQHTGQIIISILLLQDLFAILIMLVVEGLAGGGPATGIARELFALPVLIVVAYSLERYAIEPLLRRFDQIQEYLFLVVIAWCLGIAQLASALGLSHEVGAFVAGVSLASCPISQFIADSLRPLRDFFLILFFFSLGAGFDPRMISQVILPGGALAICMLVAKPYIFRWLLVRAGERRRLSGEIGVRLGQISEFSLLIALLAFESGFIGERASYTIQLATLTTFLVSSYWIVMRHPTPIAVRDSLRRD